MARIPSRDRIPTREEKQAEIERLRQKVVQEYPSTWQRIISGWSAPGAEDCAWLVYSANYLLRTGNVRWAVDLLSLAWRVPGAPRMDTWRDLQPLSFVLLTHSHWDHLDYDLLAELTGLPIRWVIPEFLIAPLCERCGLNEQQIIPARPLAPIELDGMRITPFESLHRAPAPDGRLNGVPELGYLVEQREKRWLFPGDIRTYEAACLPDFGAVDAVFAHLWLGRGAALQHPLPNLETFCHFFAALHPRRVILTHLQEFGREPEDYWDAEHVAGVLQEFQSAYPGIPVQPAYHGEKVRL